MQLEAHSAGPETRIHSLDRVRAVALLLGIVMHATMSFLPGFGDVGWPVIDVSPSVTLGVLSYVIHMFRMTLFFIIAGFFAKLLLQRAGTAGFVRNRLKRVALPLLVFLIIVVPLAIVAMVWAVAQTGPPRPPKIPPPSPGGIVPLMHLWFLYLLLLFYAAALGMRAVVTKWLDPDCAIRNVGSRFLAWTLRKHFAVLLLAAPIAALLWFTSWWVPWLGIPTPDRGFVPNLPALLAYGTAFGFGWFLYGPQDFLRGLRETWLPYLLAAIALTIGTLVIVGPTADFATRVTPTPKYAAFSFGYIVGAWCWSFALIGAAGRFFAAESRPFRYLADASYWMYLMHLPMVFALQAWMMRWPIHWSIKFALIVALTTAVLLVSYHFLVRFTWIGAWLSGRRKARPVATAVAVSQ
jgi:glucans biosynthesis protein C